MGHWLPMIYAYFRNSFTLIVILSEAKNLVAFLGEILRYAQHDKGPLAPNELCLFSKQIVQDSGKLEQGNTLQSKFVFDCG